MKKKLYQSEMNKPITYMKQNGFELWKAIFNAYLS